ncbi:MAG: hypothetical protein H7838_01080 [Magnetococcus sp. DMHC-8]
MKYAVRVLLLAVALSVGSLWAAGPAQAWGGWPGGGLGWSGRVAGQQLGCTLVQ